MHMNSIDTITCKNCSTQFQGNYCPNCRQSAHTHRITWHELAHHLMHAFFHLDRGILHTITEMFLRPGKTISDYLNGKRAYHFNPLLFLILLGGMTSLLFAWLHIGTIAERLNTESIEKITPALAHKHYTIIAVVVLLFLTLTDFVFYRHKKYTLPELLVSNSFQIGELLFFLILSLPFLYLQNYINSHYHTHIEIRSFLIILFYFYFFLVRYQLYAAKRKYITILKIIFQLILVYIVIQHKIAKSMLEMIQ